VGGQHQTLSFYSPGSSSWSALEWLETTTAGRYEQILKTLKIEHQILKIQHQILKIQHHILKIQHQILGRTFISLTTLGTESLRFQS
jgi:hypothetical protein